MRIGDARRAAADWVARHQNGAPDFLGAYLVGSTASLPDDAQLPLGSDIDVFVVHDTAAVPPKPGKVVHAGVLLDVTVLPWSAISTPDEVLTSYHLANGLRADTILVDPSGRLRAVQRYVTEHFAEEAWVRRRCQDVAGRIESGLDGLSGAELSAPWHDLVTWWLFPTGQTAHVLLVAALRNPTVRLRYLAAREVLDRYGRPDLYRDLIDLLGAGDLTAAQAERHVGALARTFDAAAVIAKTPFPFSSDITPAARATAIDASLALIRAGDQREAMFWIVATFARCHKILAADAPPALQREHAEAFHDAVRDIGIASTADLLARADAVRQYLPKLRACADEIVAANAGVTRAPHA